jgi:copper chaperone CopZ
MMEHKLPSSICTESQRVTIVLDGLASAGCGAPMVERQILSVPGVIRVFASLATEMAYIDYEPGQVTHDALTQAIWNLSRLYGYRYAQRRRVRTGLVSGRADRCVARAATSRGNLGILKKEVLPMKPGSAQSRLVK